MWSPSLQLARDGRCVAYITEHGVTIETRGGARAELALPRVRSLAAFDDQLWTIAEDRLQRWRLDGRALGGAVSVPRDGALVPALAGPAMAAWSNAARAWIDHGDGELRELPLLDTLVIAPFAGRRWFVIDGDRVRLGSATIELAGGKLVATAAVRDHALLVVVRDVGREARIYDRDGTLLATRALPDGELRLAAATGLVIARDGAKLVALELATGATRELASWHADIADFAIDADAATLAVRDADGVHFLVLRERPIAQPAPEPAPEIAPPPPAPEPARATSASWIAAELDRIWLLGERQLRRLQLAGVRPGPGTAQMIGIETLLKLRRRDGDLDRAIANAVARVGRAREDASIRALAERCAMTELELEILAFAVAAAIDPSLGELFAALRGVPSRRTLDLALVGELLELAGDDTAALVAACIPSRPLLAWRFVQLDAAYDVHASPLQRACHVAPEVASALAGDVGWLGGEHAIEHAEATLDDLALDAATRTRIASLARQAPPWLVIYGPRGNGKRTIAARLAAYWGRPIAIVEPRTAKLEERLKLAQRDALLADAVLCVGPIAAGIDASDLVAALANFPNPVVLAFETLEPPRLRTPHACDELALPLPGEPARAYLWQQELGEGAHVATLASNFRLTPGEIARAAEEARAGDDAPRERRVRAAIERCLRNELGQIARKLPTSVGFDDVVLAPEKLQRVRELVARRRYAHRVYGEWGVAGNIEYGRGLIALLSGPPGTGKTLLARVIAQALDLDLYQVDLASVFSRWVGETEKALARVFDQAERAHAVLLFDEADALFAKRTSMDDSKDRYANVTVNFLLQRLEQYDGVAVMTTNKQAALDEAMARRLTLHLHLDEPEPVERERLWRQHLPARAPGASSVDVALLARELELTGGYIKNIAVRAAFLAAARSNALSTALVREAAYLELEDLGRVVTRKVA